MPATPERIRRALRVITANAIREVRAVAAEEADPPAKRAALFAATPLIVSGFTEGSAALALDWFDDLRDEFNSSPPFASEPVVNAGADYITAQIAKATREMWLIFEDEIDEAAASLAKVIDLDAKRLTKEALAEVATEVALDRIDPIVQKQVASGFRDTIRENVHRDPAAVGWRRHTRGPASCRFCRMLAAKGAIYKKDTALFAAHEHCYCVAVPVWPDGTEGPEASVMQYVASKRKRTAAEKKRLRDYLNEHYPAPTKPVDLDQASKEIEARSSAT